MPKPQRIRDPLHDLIEFDVSDFEQGLWNVIDTAEFQRLRRIKQLGFSELVYPGATHSRFLHSVGVFHTARLLSALLERTLGGKFDHRRANISLAAALVHDVGHGPLSHAFEAATKQLDKLRGIKGESRHEIRTAEVIRENTSLGNELENVFGPEGREEIATLLLQETPTDVYSSIVSSQFDADRLDYLRRDRLMTGAQHGGFDFPWLLANLEVENVTFETDGEEFATSEMLILGPKAFQAAEAYVLGLFHLYFAVYFHKATRAAEKMLTALLVRLGQLCDNDSIADTGLGREHPLVKFVNESSLENYLILDDSVVWGSLPMLASANDADLSELAERLLKRNLYKSVNVASRLGGNDALIAQFRGQLSQMQASGEFSEVQVFQDNPRRSPYKRRGYDSNEALEKVLIRPEKDGPYKDLSEISDVVKALNEKKVFRVYVKDDETRHQIEALAAEIAK